MTSAPTILGADADADGTRPQRADARPPDGRGLISRSAGRTAVVLTLLLAAATVVLTGIALGRPEWLVGIPSTIGSARGTAFVCLVVATPLLLGGAWWGTRGSVRGLLVWAGAAAYLTYNAVLFAWGMPFGRTFPAAVAVLGCGFWTLLALLTGVRAELVAASFGPRLPARTVGGYLVGVAAAFALLWLRDIVPAVLSGGLSASVRETGMATNPVEVIDLAVSLPGCVLAGAWLWRRRPWGLVLSGLFLVLNTVETLGVAVDQWFAAGADPAFSAGAVPVFLVLTVVQASVTWLFLRHASPRIPTATIHEE